MSTPENFELDLSRKPSRGPAIVLAIVGLALAGAIALSPPEWWAFLGFPSDMASGLMIAATGVFVSGSLRSVQVEDRATLSGNAALKEQSALREQIAHGETALARLHDDATTG